jgi:flavin-dependent dehydrogenase
MRFDVVIVGGGPAGTAAAISAARAGREALLLERGRLPRHKVCGEFVSPEGAALLAELLGPAASILVAAPRLDRARIFMDGRAAETKLEPAALSITRFALDHALWRAAEEAGVDCRAEVTVEGVESHGAQSHVVTSAGTFDAPLVINASGRWSKLSRPRRENRGGIGLKAHFSERAPSRTVDLYFFSGGYCGVQPISAERVNVCALVRGTGPKSLEEVWRCSPELQRRSAGWTALWRPIAASPLIFGAPRPVQDGMLCVGDAAGFVDPFVGDGISLALTTGMMAGTMPEAEAYVREYERRLAPVFRSASALRALASAPPSLRRAALAGLRLPVLGSLAFRLTRPRANTAR